MTKRNILMMMGVVFSKTKSCKDIQCKIPKTYSNQLYVVNITTEKIKYFVKHVKE